MQKTPPPGRGSGIAPFVARSGTQSRRRKVGNEFVVSVAVEIQVKGAVAVESSEWKWKNDKSLNQAGPVAESAPPSAALESQNQIGNQVTVDRGGSARISSRR